MKELLDIYNSGTNYCSILKKLGKIKPHDRSHVDHIASKIRFDGRSNSPRRTQQGNSDIPPLTTSTQYNMFG